MSVKYASKFSPLSRVAFGAVGATYTQFGNGLAFACEEIAISSSLNEDVILSTDGVTDMIGVAALSTFSLSVGSFLRDCPNGLAQNTVWFIKYATASPTSGSLSITCVGLPS